MAYYDIADRNGNGVIRVNYTVSQDARNNRSTVTVNSIGFYSTNWYATWFYAAGTVQIGSGSVYYGNTGTSDGCYVSGQYEEATLGSGKTMPSFTVTHDSSGNGSFAISLLAASGYSDFNLFCASSTKGNCEWSGGTSATVALPKIDRSAPTVNISASAASASSISLSASSNVNCDNWQYQVDNGSWVTFSTTNGTSASTTITGLTAGSHTVRVWARKYSNYVGGYSSSTTVDTALPTVTASISDVTSSSISVSASASVTCNIWQYRIGSGSWTTFSTTEGTSGSFTLDSLDPNTEYTITVRARKKANNLYGTAAAVSATTLGGSLLHSVADVTMDDTTPAASFVATVYGSFYHCFRIYAEDGTTLLRTLNFSSLQTGTQRTYTFNYPSATRTALLNSFPNAKTCVFKVRLDTYTDSTQGTLVGSSEMKSFTARTTAANSAPTFSAFTYQDTETETTDATGDDQTLIQSYSHLVVTATAGTGKNGGTISGYSVSIGDKSLSGNSTTLDVGAVNSSGDLTLTVTCTDSRGYATSVTKTVRVLPYSKPRFTTYTLRRRNEIDKLIQLHFSGAVSSIMPDDTEKNSVVSISFKYKLTSAAESAYVTVDLTNDADMTISGLTFTFGTDELMELDETLSYDFVFYVYDELGNLTVFEYPDILNQGTPILALRKRSSSNNRPRVGINNPTPYYELDVHGDIAQHDILIQGFVADLGEDYISNLRSGGIYTQDDATQAQTLKGYPVAKAGLLEVLANPAGMVIQRYTPYDMTAVYTRCYNSLASSPGWTNWKSHTLS